MTYRPPRLPPSRQKHQCRLRFPVRASPDSDSSDKQSSSSSSRTVFYAHEGIWIFNRLCVLLRRIPFVLKIRGRTRCCDGLPCSSAPSTCSAHSIFMTGAGFGSDHPIRCLRCHPHHTSSCILDAVVYHSAPSLIHLLHSHCIASSLSTSLSYPTLSRPLASNHISASPQLVVAPPGPPSHICGDLDLPTLAVRDLQGLKSRGCLRASVLVHFRSCAPPMLLISAVDVSIALRNPSFRQAPPLRLESLDPPLFVTTTEGVDRDSPHDVEGLCRWELSRGLTPAGSSSADAVASLFHDLHPLS